MTIALMGNPVAKRCLITIPMVFAPGVAFRPQDIQDALSDDRKVLRHIRDAVESCCTMPPVKEGAEYLKTLDLGAVVIEVLTPESDERKQK